MSLRLWVALFSIVGGGLFVVIVSHLGKSWPGSPMDELEGLGRDLDLKVLVSLAMVIATMIYLQVDRLCGYALVDDYRNAPPSQLTVYAKSVVARFRGRSMPETDLSLDHFRLEDTRITRRYFGKFARITRHLGQVAATMQAEGRLTKTDIAALTGCLVGLNHTFTALAHKYHFAGRASHAGQLTIDRVESGFPVYQELLEMANDALQARQHLAGMPSVDDLKRQMVQQIVGDLTIPTKLQFALSQRLYYEELVKGGQFWARNDPQAVFLSNRDDRRQFLVHWAVYDSQVNLPTLYLMDVEDTGRVSLPKDDRRWPLAQSHLMAQSLGGLKLMTIATGFDADFDDLHPVRLRRFHVGPMYSSAFTQQNGPLREVLDVAQSPVGEDWALVWTEEDLQTERVEKVKSGWFGSVERQIFARDPFDAVAQDRGLSRMDRSIIMPARPYQALSERRPAGFEDVRKFVVGHDGRVRGYR